MGENEFDIAVTSEEGTDNVVTITDTMTNGIAYDTVNNDFHVTKKNGDPYSVTPTMLNTDNTKFEFIKIR